MSNAIKPVLLAGMLAAAGVTMAPSLAPAADLAVAAPMHHAARWCGPCGCLHVGYVRHRELRTTYGIAFDPRNYATSKSRTIIWDLCGPIRGIGRAPVLSRA
jgi:hypothetical protein